ncbi:MAG: type II CAAX endopeptidase family protein [Bacillota bacterium]|nr:type II CAAX endopeptidase family protein [Bacillota bacterium]
MKKYFGMVGNIVIYFLVYLGLQMVMGAFAGIFITIKNLTSLNKVNIADAINKYAYVLVAFAAIGAFLIYILLLKNKEENLFQRCSFKKVKSTNILWIFIICITFSFFSISMIYVLTNVFPDYQEKSKNIANGVSTIAGILCAVLLLPAFEEVLFRGLIFKELKKHLNLPVSVILQALIFAVAHGNPLQGIYTFMLGVMLALVYTWTRSIWANIFFHASYNLFGTSIISIAVYYSRQFIPAYLILGAVLTILLMVKYCTHTKKSSRSQIERPFTNRYGEHSD